MLEQEAHKFGLRERAFPFSGIASPQPMQTRGCILPHSQPQLLALQVVIEVHCCTDSGVILKSLPRESEGSRVASFDHTAQESAQLSTCETSIQRSKQLVLSEL
jgi:hypothetical protein